MIMGFDLAGNGGVSFPFNNIGDSVTGRIMSVEEVPQTDPKTNKPQYWNDDPSQPKTQHRVVLQTDLRNDGEDDGRRAIYLRGSRKPESQSSLSAVLAAARETTGGTSIDIGGYIQLTYIGDGVQNNRAFSAPKLYSARYKPPTADLGGQQPPAAQTYQQPVPTPPPAAQQPAWGQQPPAPAPAPQQQPAAAADPWGQQAPQQTASPYGQPATPEPPF